MKLNQIQKISIIGSGTMGSGIALCFSLAGYSVSLYSKSKLGLLRAQKRIKYSIATFINEKLINKHLGQSTLVKIGFTNSLEDCVLNAQFILESIPEQLELKQKLFQLIELKCAADAILSTNTSGLSITEIAYVCKNPERVIGLHWANPAEIVPLVEVIKGKLTSIEVSDLTYKLAERIGKMPVMIEKEVPGFASNRLQFAMLREALHLVESGVVKAEDVDKVLKGGVGFRYPWLGPLETADLGGLDVFYKISEYLFEKLSVMKKPPPSFKKIIDKGNLGIKTGEGFYKYNKGDDKDILRKRDLYFMRQLKLIREMDNN